MAYRSHTASPAGSASPSSSSSTNASPYIGTSPLDNMLSHDDADSAYSSAQGTPNHSTTSLPRSLSAGKGGCWTCRVRRKVRPRTRGPLRSANRPTEMRRAARGRLVPHLQAPDNQVPRLGREAAGLDAGEHRALRCCGRGAW